MAKIDAESRAMHLSRSRLLGMAAIDYLEDRHRKQAIEQYVRSYAEHPETDEELEVTDAFLREAWANDE
ncbi:MAG: hypothetical protein ACREN8_02680 [Candidatus Dormibacteraceae bacterium]